MKDKDWQAKLDPDQFKVLRRGATEPPGSGVLLNNKDQGDYICAGCSNKLFNSQHKFESGSGWPSFYDFVSNKAVKLKQDKSHGMSRTEVICAKCDGHLGHVFDDAFDQPTGKRYCINSKALCFKGQDGQIKQG